MEDRARRASSTAVEAARQRLARLKFASVTASVVAFGGLTAAIAMQVSATPVSASSTPAASGAAQPSVVPPVYNDDAGDQVAPGTAVAPPAAQPPAATAPAPPIVSAQS